MQPPELKVVDIQPPNYRCPVKMLRTIADSIENGEHGDVTTIVVALQGDTIDTFGGGRDADYRFCSYLFSVGLTRLAECAG